MRRLTRDADLQVAPARQTGSCAVGQDCRCLGPPRGTPGCPKVSPGLCLSLGAASGARPPDEALRHGPELSGPRILLEGPRDAPRFLPGSVHRPRSFLCAARGCRCSSPCLFDVTGGVSGGASPTVHCQTMGHDPEVGLPLF
jgi:hypothetical protein